MSQIVIGYENRANERTWFSIRSNIQFDQEI